MLSNRQHNNSSKEGADTAPPPLPTPQGMKRIWRVDWGRQEATSIITTQMTAARRSAASAARLGSIYPSFLNGYQGILPFIAQLKWLLCCMYHRYLVKYISSSSTERSRTYPRVPNEIDEKLILFWKFFPPTFFSPNKQNNLSYISFFSPNKFQKNSKLLFFGTTIVFGTLK